jgi:hypothetical protein
MTYLLEVETTDSKKAFTEEFLMTLPFVKSLKPFVDSKPLIYQYLDEYKKTGVVNPASHMSVEEMAELAEVFAEDESPPEEMTYEERRKKLDDYFNQHLIDLSNFKFNRDEANNYD